MMFMSERNRAITSRTSAREHPEVWTWRHDFPGFSSSSLSRERNLKVMSFMSFMSTNDGGRDA
jgi:hypothetical protein